MEAGTKRRSRWRPQKTTGIIKHTIQDAVGFCEPLSRYGQLPTEILGAFYNLANKNALTSVTYKDRLTRLIQESEGLTSQRKILYRPDYQRRFGINQQSVYRKTLGTALTLFRFDVYDEQRIRWANNTQVMKYEAEREPTDHDQELSIVAASIELEARKHRAFVSHIDILANASEEAQKANSPLSIPIAKLSHKFPNDARLTVIDKTFVKPDFLFGVGYPENVWKFFALEYDRSTEEMEPTKNLYRQSGLRKILTYSAISASKYPIYETYLRIPNLIALFVFRDRRRAEHFQRLVKNYASYPSQFKTMVVTPFDPVLQPNLMPHLFHRPWQSADGSGFSILEGR